LKNEKERECLRRKGDRVLFHMRLFLNKGDEVPLNETQATHLPKEMIQTVDGSTFVDRTIVLGGREAIAGVEHALIGMKAGGYRKVRILILPAEIKAFRTSFLPTRC
jgi:FKBP-type peptidyl-prolyl cis-trans isomerase 2